MTITADLLTRLNEAAAARELLLATDFDGTIAPFQNDPSRCRALPGTVEALESLARLPRTHAALVSGRDLATLASLSGAPSPVVLIGSHGGESSDPQVSSPASLDAGALARLDAIAEAFTMLRRRYPHARIERKTAAVAWHTREVPTAEQLEALDAAARLASTSFGMRPLFGKQVVECSVLEVTKGASLRRLARAVGASAVVYFGDDTTDETVFSEFASDPSALTVKVGAGTTSAHARVECVQDAAEAIVTVAALRLEVAMKRDPAAR